MPELVQLSAAELRQMGPEAIVAARRAGQFSELLAGRDPGSLDETVPADTAPPVGSADQGARHGPNLGGQLTVAELQSMTPEAIVEARKAGRLESLRVGR